MTGSPSGARQRIIDRNRYNPTEDQKLAAYRPFIDSQNRFTMKMPGDIVIGEGGRVVEVK
jgi:hypothetical protein